MSRLTHKARWQAGYKANRNVYAWECIDKLGQLEDLEEQGLLVKLPCKVGDTVFADSGVFGILEYTVDGIVIDNLGFIFQASAYSDPIGDCPSEGLDEFEKDISEFDKTVFLTREQAEQALRKMEGTK